MDSLFYPKHKQINVKSYYIFKILNFTSLKNNRKPSFTNRLQLSGTSMKISKLMSHKYWCECELLEAFWKTISRTLDLAINFGIQQKKKEDHYIRQYE